MTALKDFKNDQVKYGKYYTTKNVFVNNRVFSDFIDRFNLWAEAVLEPFAGANHLIKHLQTINNKWTFKAFDLWPNGQNIIKNDSLKNWNYGTNVPLIITNPPYLAKNKATKLKLGWDYHDQPYDDLYKIALATMLKNCRFLIAIIPTTLIYSQQKCDQWLLEKLVKFQIINQNDNFEDANLLIALAYFDRYKNDNIINFELYQNEILIGNYQTLQWSPARLNHDIKVIFNAKKANLEIKCIDGSKANDLIRFIDIKTIKRPVKTSDRQICQIRVEGVNINEHTISQLNEKLAWLRQHNYHYLWTTFKSTNQLNQVRRRARFKLIRQIIQSVL